MNMQSIFDFYPLLIVVAGFGVAMVLSERAVAMMSVETKARVIDAFSKLRWLNFLGVGVFAILLLWRVQVAWIVVGIEYSALAVWSARRVRRLSLSDAISTRLIWAMIVRALGLAICAAIMSVRLLQ